MPFKKVDEIYKDYVQENNKETIPYIQELEPGRHLEQLQAHLYMHCNFYRGVYNHEKISGVDIIKKARGLKTEFDIKLLVQGRDGSCIYTEINKISDEVFTSHLLENMKPDTEIQFVIPKSTNETEIIAQIKDFLGIEFQKPEPNEVGYASIEFTPKNYTTVLQNIVKPALSLPNDIRLEAGSEGASEEVNAKSYISVLLFLGAHKGEILKLKVGFHESNNNKKIAKKLIEGKHWYWPFSK